MSWRKITMKFTGTCIICNEKINANEIGFWAKGLGVKHEKCAKVIELQCMVCGNSAGCQNCEFRDSCDLENVSQVCICKKCSEKSDSLILYQKSSQTKFPLLKLE